MLTGDFETHPHHVYQAGEVEVLKAAAIYGANGAGKSNLVKAIGCLQEWVKVGEITTSVDRRKFKLDPACQEKPVQFEIEFYTNGKLYAYGISVDGTMVQEEWLHEVGVTKKDKLIFARTTGNSGKPNLEFAKEYQKTQKQRLLIELMRDNLLKENQLLLGKHEELKIKEIRDAQTWIAWGVGIRHATAKNYESIERLISSRDAILFTKELLKTLDVGAEDVYVEETELSSSFDVDNQQKQQAIQEIGEREDAIIHTLTSNGPVYIAYKDGRYVLQKLILNHKGPTTPVPFYLSEESDGTHKILSYIPSIYMFADYPVTYIFDEVDQSIHPSLLKKLLQKIMSNKTTKGQLIFTTHESNLLDLDIFRQDEIWFAEKERETGATHFYSLSEFKPNYGSDIEKGYLNGRFGAIPFLGNLETLNWHAHAEAE